MKSPFSARIVKIADDIRASYWFVPTCLVLCAVGMAGLSLSADRHPDRLPAFLTFFTVINNVDSARAVVSVIAQSSIGVAGVLFSITMLAVSFASGQFGPRLIGGFMRDRGNQWSLGILISTFTFSLLVLRAIGAADLGVDAQGLDEGFVPHLSILIAVGLALVSVFIVIFHVHHVPETISISNITAGLGRRFTAQVEQLGANAPNPATAQPGPHVDIAMTTAGYVHTIATAKLSDLALARGWTIELCAMPGDFIHAGHCALRVTGTTSLPPEDADLLRHTIALGNSKTEDHNLLFVVEQLVEIVARAMSPGVNDPFTAITCMQWLETGLTLAARRSTPLTVVTQGAVLAKPLPFDLLLERALGDCVFYTKDDVLTRRALLDLLAGLASRAAPVNRQAIAKVIARLTEA